MAFIQAKSAQGSSTTPAVTLDNAPTPGSILYCAMSSPSLVTFSLSGWNKLTEASGGSGSTTRDLAIFWKIADGTETTIQGSVANTAWCMGVIEEDHGGVMLAENNAITVSGVTHTTPAVTPRGIMPFLVIIASCVRANSTWSGEQVNSSASGVTERVDVTNGSNNALQISELYVTTPLQAGYTGVATSSGTNVGSAAIAVFGATSLPNNYQFVKVGDGMSAGERIR